MSSYRRHNVSLMFRFPNIILFQRGIYHLGKKEENSVYVIIRLQNLIYTFSLPLQRNGFFAIYFSPLMFFCKKTFKESKQSKIVHKIIF